MPSQQKDYTSNYLIMQRLSSVLMTEVYKAEQTLLSAVKEYAHRTPLSYTDALRVATQIINNLQTDKGRGFNK